MWVHARVCMWVRVCERGKEDIGLGRKVQLKCRERRERRERKERKKGEVR